MKERLLNLLIRSFDEELTEAERRELQNALAADAELREQKRQLQEVRHLVRESAVRSFKPFFAARVMRRVAAGPSQRSEFLDALLWLFRRVAIVGSLTILLLVAGLVLSGKEVSFDSLMGMPQLTLDDTLQLQNPILEEAQ